MADGHQLTAHQISLQAVRRFGRGAGRRRSRLMVGACAGLMLCGVWQRDVPLALLAAIGLVLVAANRWPIASALGAQAAAAGAGLAFPGAGSIAAGLATLASAPICSPQVVRLSGALGVAWTVGTGLRQQTPWPSMVAGAVALSGVAWFASAWTEWVRRRASQSARRRALDAVREEEVERQLASAALTERRLVELAAHLHTTQEQLQADIRQRQELADQLSLTLQRADETRRAKSAFFASISHELRTPLNAIIGFSSVLRKNAGGTADPKAATYLDRIHRSGTQLLAIINDILDLSRIEADKVAVETQDADLAMLVQDTIDLLAGQAQPGVILTAELPEGQLITKTDPARLRQVLVNLVSNALKFTRTGSVTVRVLLDKGGPPASVEVIDTGAGIAPDRLDAIFLAFEQADNSTARVYGGTGLGLAICRQLCALLNTHLSVASVLGQGSTFTLRLPVAGMSTPLHVNAPVAALSGASDLAL